MTSRDYFTAVLPVAANLTLSEVNSLCGIAGALLGIAYLAWKWRRESKEKSP